MSVTLTDVEPRILHLDDSGTIRVGGTRVTLDTLAAAFHTGATAEQIAQDFPSLELADVYAALGSYLRQQRELDAYLVKRERDAVESRARNGTLYATDVRSRLLSRRAVGKP